MNKIYRKFISVISIVALISNFVIPPSIFAQSSYLKLPTPNAILHLSSSYIPVLLKGIQIFPDDPLKFNFIVDSGDSGLEGDDLKEDSTKVIKYFLAGLTVPEEDLWVNLSPYEKDRIIPKAFGETEMGRDLLAQDYFLKQLTASLIYPEDELGIQFWDTVYQKTYEAYGTTNIPINTFNKVWIVPQKAVVYEQEDKGFVIESRLGVMMEEDYLSMENNLNNKEIGTDRIDQDQIEKLSSISSEVVRNIILPAIEKEVNEGENFSPLRQIYHSLILAAWFKKTLKESLLGQAYVNQNKIAGIDIEDKRDKEKIYNQYLKAFEQGVYDYVKVDDDPYMQKDIKRRYVSGGADLFNLFSTDIETGKPPVIEFVQKVALPIKQRIQASSSLSSIETKLNLSQESSSMLNKDISWKGLQQEGYSVQLSNPVKQIFQALAPKVVKVDIYRNQINQNAVVSLHIFPDQKIIIIPSFYPKFLDPQSADQKIGRGRAFLRYLLKDYPDYHILGEAVPLFQHSLLKMLDFHTNRENPEITNRELLKNGLPSGKNYQEFSSKIIASLDDLELTLKQRNNLMRSLKNANFHLKVPKASSSITLNQKNEVSNMTFSFESPMNPRRGVLVDNMSGDAMQSQYDSKSGTHIFDNKQADTFISVSDLPEGSHQDTVVILHELFRIGAVPNIKTTGIVTDKDNGKQYFLQETKKIISVDLDSSIRDKSIYLNNLLTNLIDNGVVVEDFYFKKVVFGAREKGELERALLRGVNRIRFMTKEEAIKKYISIIQDNWDSTNESFEAPLQIAMITNLEKKLKKLENISRSTKTSRGGNRNVEAQTTYFLFNPSAKQGQERTFVYDGTGISMETFEDYLMFLKDSNKKAGSINFIATELQKEIPKTFISIPALAKNPDFLKRLDVVLNKGMAKNREFSLQNITNVKFVITENGNPDYLGISDVVLEFPESSKARGVDATLGRPEEYAFYRPILRAPGIPNGNNSVEKDAFFRELLEDTLGVEGMQELLDQHTFPKAEYSYENDFGDTFQVTIESNPFESRLNEMTEGLNNFSAELMSMENLPKYMKGRVDLIATDNMTTHMSIKEVDAYMKQRARALKEGGQLIITNVELISMGTQQGRRRPGIETFTVTDIFERTGMGSLEYKGTLIYDYISGKPLGLKSFNQRRHLIKINPLRKSEVKFFTGDRKEKFKSIKKVFDDFILGDKRIFDKSLKQDLEDEFKNFVDLQAYSVEYSTEQLVDRLMRIFKNFILGDSWRDRFEARLAAPPVAVPRDPEGIGSAREAIVSDSTGQIGGDILREEFIAGGITSVEEVVRQLGAFINLYSDQSTPPEARVKRDAPEVSKFFRKYKLDAGHSTDKSFQRSIADMALSHIQREGTVSSPVRSLTAGSPVGKVRENGFYTLKNINYPINYFKDNPLIFEGSINSIHFRKLVEEVSDQLEIFAQVKGSLVYLSNKKGYVPFQLIGDIDIEFENIQDFNLQQQFIQELSKRIQQITKDLVLTGRRIRGGQAIFMVSMKLNGIGLQKPINFSSIKDLDAKTFLSDILNILEKEDFLKENRLLLLKRFFGDMDDFFNSLNRRVENKKPVNKDEIAKETKEILLNIKRLLEEDSSFEERIAKQINERMAIINMPWLTSQESVSSPLISKINKFNKGGIDLTKERMDVQTRGAGVGFDIPAVDLQMIEQMNFDGLEPEILMITPIPASQIPMLLGVVGGEPKEPLQEVTNREFYLRKNSYI